MESMQLVALDLDGTLLTPNQNISRRNRQAIRRATQAGVHVVICSGRIAYSAVQFAKTLGLTDPVIAVNGAHVVDPVSGQTLSLNSMPNAMARKCVEVAETLNLYSCVFKPFSLHSRQVAYSMRKYAEMIKHTNGPVPLDVKVEESTAAVIAAAGDEALKVVLAGDPGKLAQARKLLDDPGLEVTSSWFDNLEILASGVHKGTGLAFVADYLGVPRDRVMAMGDNENDLGMLRFAGMPVAMGNGEACVKEAAQYVTAPNHRCGVAVAIERFCPGARP